VVRAALTAIDYNSNVGRMPAVDKDGEARYNVVNSRDGQVYVGICLYAAQNIEIEMTIPNMFSIDRYWWRYNLLFRRNPHFKMTQFSNVRVYGWLF